MTTPVLIDDVALESQDTSAGWSISEFRLPVRGAGFVIFHGRFRPGSRHSVHRHRLCDELCIYMRGRGLVGTGEDRYAVGPGDARVIPAGVPHYFHNAGSEGVAEVLGIYVGAESVEGTGYELVGPIGEQDLRRSAAGTSAVVHPWTRAGSAPLVAMPGWKETDFRVLVDDVHVSCLSAVVEPGGGFVGRREDALVVYIDSGHCFINDAPAHGGHIWQVAPGEHISLRNASATEKLMLYGFAVSDAESRTEDVSR